MLHAQSAVDEDFAVVLTLGGGYSHYIQPYDLPIAINRSGLTGSARLMWHPDHRLRVGLESGWSAFYHYALEDVETSFGYTDASLSLSAVPLLVIFSMPLTKSLELHAGTGGFLVRSHATSFGNTVDVTAFSQGWMAAASWKLTEWTGVRIESEVKWYGATQFDDGVVIVQLQGSIDLFHW
jgi:hypothetical protein